MNVVRLAGDRPFSTGDCSGHEGDNGSRSTVTHLDVPVGRSKRFSGPVAEGNFGLNLISTQG
jgi:hypothetical protein